MNSFVENTKIYITFPVPTEKEFTRIDKHEERITKNISIEFIDIAKFIDIYVELILSNLVNNLAE